jgi:hypothetical protein
VYLQFGSSNLADEDVETSYSGNFKFDYLWQGKYTVYVYSEDVRDNSTADIVVSADVEITEMGQVVTVEDELIIEKI